MSNKTKNQTFNKYAKPKPQLINKWCSCGKQLNEIHLFFDSDKCGTCERIYIVNSKK